MHHMFWSLRSIHLYRPSKFTGCVLLIEWFVAVFRFRIVDECFTDTTPMGPDSSTQDADKPDSDNKKAPYIITVCHLI